MMTLPTDSNDRKDYALFRGCLRYFPAALAGIAKISKLGNDKHNPGQELFHDRNKSKDHGDCILRHLMDVSDLIAANDRGELDNKNEILNEVSSMAWRALALSQELHEKFGSPVAPAANTQSKKYDGIDLHKAAEKAHEEIAARKAKFPRGEIVKHVNNDVEVIVEATYFDENGKSIMFVKDPTDPNGKTVGVDPTFYKSIYKE